MPQVHDPKTGRYISGSGGSSFKNADGNKITKGIVDSDKATGKKIFRVGGVVEAYVDAEGKYFVLGGMDKQTRTPLDADDIKELDYPRYGTGALLPKFKVVTSRNKPAPDKPNTPKVGENVKPKIVTERHIVAFDDGDYLHMQGTNHVGSTKVNRVGMEESYTDRYRSFQGRVFEVTEHHTISNGGLSYHKGETTFKRVE